MIIDCVADLHGHYPELEGGDLLIVAGDLTEADTHAEYLKFYAWLHRQQYKHYIFIAGNHDNLIEKDEVLLRSLADTTYLCDSGTNFNCLDIGADGVKIVSRRFKIWGSPWTPLSDDVDPRYTAFMLPEAELAAKFALIPDDTDILVTHGPPKGMLDLSTDAERCGSQSLTNKIHRLQLRAHIFGHIHEGYGKENYFIPAHNYIGMCDCQFVNCSHVNERYEPVNKPIRVIV